MENISQPLSKSIDFFHQELNGLRVGRASPALVENVLVEYYGTPTPLVQLASITTPDARTLAIQPWDVNAVKDVERALNAADLGASPSLDGNLIRVIIPTLTEERRIELVKVLGEKTEKAKVAVRQIREDALKELKTAKDAGALSEDAFFQKQKEIQEEIDEATKKISEIQEAKKLEITTI